MPSSRWARSATAPPSSRSTSSPSRPATRTSAAWRWPRSARSSRSPPPPSSHPPSRATAESAAPRKRIAEPPSRPETSSRVGILSAPPLRAQALFERFRDERSQELSFARALQANAAPQVARHTRIQVHEHLVHVVHRRCFPTSHDACPPCERASTLRWLPPRPCKRGCPCGGTALPPGLSSRRAEVAELADAADSKSAA